MYPRNSCLLGLLAMMEMRAHTVSRLRRDLRSMLEAAPSPQLWLLALRCEAALPGGAHRVQVPLLSVSVAVSVVFPCTRSVTTHYNRQIALRLKWLGDHRPCMEIDLHVHDVLIKCVLQALFERALSAKQTQQCALLWRAYIGYELQRGRPEAARRVFLRAIHACPWCKVWE